MSDPTSTGGPMDGQMFEGGFRRAGGADRPLGGEAREEDLPDFDGPGSAASSEGEGDDGEIDGEEEMQCLLLF